MIVLLKLLIVVAVVGLMRSSTWFRNMSRELDESAIASIKRIMRASEEFGYPPEAVPLLIILTALFLTALVSVTRFYP